MATIEYKTLVMAGPMRWVVLTTNGEVTTLAWFVKVRYTAQGGGNVLFARSDLQGNGRDDVFAVFSDNLAMAEHLRDDATYLASATPSLPVFLTKAPRLPLWKPPLRARTTFPTASSNP